ncbi:hypothetical protein Lal_00001384 [Lupinus albus]|nr:hypothetical protein Lal_00001384 [Lupinus albus]
MEGEYHVFYATSIQNPFNTLFLHAISSTPSDNISTNDISPSNSGFSKGEVMTLDQRSDRNRLYPVLRLDS